MFPLQGRAGAEPATGGAFVRRADVGYRREHPRALAQRVEVAEGEVRIMGSKSRLLLGRRWGMAQIRCPLGD